MYVLLKSAVLLLAILGYGLLCQKKRLPLCFFPVVCISGISLTVYGFGLVGLLKPASYAVAAGGLALLALYARPKQLKAFFMEPSLWFAALSAVWLYMITRGVMLSRWDDGSHWYRVCKSVFYENAFPTTPDILYYDYVPGMQAWNYFVLRYIGFSIPHCMFAQNLVNIACLAPLFAAIRSVTGRTYKAVCAAIIGVAAVKICSMSMGTYTLMVDLQVGLVAMAALIYMLDQGEERGAAAVMTILLAFLSIIKNNGPLFAAMIIVWAARQYRWKGRRLAVRTLIPGGVCAVMYGAYQLRSILVYHSTRGGLQGISLERFAELLAQKDGQTILEITKVFWGEVFFGLTGQNVTLYICFALLILLALSLKDNAPDAAAQVRRVAVGLAVMLGVYSLFLYATYLLAMTVEEALLAYGFVRYFGSAVALIAGVTVYTSLRQFAYMTRCAGQAPHWLTLGFILFAVTSMQGLGTDEYILGRDKWNMPGTHHPSVWYALEYYVPENKQYTEDRYVVLWAMEDFDGHGLENARMAYNAGAWVRSSDVLAISKDDILAGLDESVLNSLSSYDYLICMSDLTGQSAALEEALGTTDLSVGVRAIAP